MPGCKYLFEEFVTYDHRNGEIQIPEWDGEYICVVKREGVDSRKRVVKTGDDFTYSGTSKVMSPIERWQLVRLSPRFWGPLGTVKERKLVALVPKYPLPDPLCLAGLAPPTPRIVAPSYKLVWEYAPKPKPQPEPEPQPEPTLNQTRGFAVGNDLRIEAGIDYEQLLSKFDSYTSRVELVRAANEVREFVPPLPSQEERTGAVEALLRAQAERLAEYELKAGVAREALGRTTRKFMDFPERGYRDAPARGSRGYSRRF